MRQRDFAWIVMKSIKQKPKTIDKYLPGVNADHRNVLEKVRRTIRAVAPKAEECISYGIPAFRLDGRSLLFFGAWANHCALYPGSSAMLKKFRNDLRDFQTSKSTIRFSAGKPLLVSLVKKLVKARVAEIGYSANKNRTKT